MPPCGSSRTYSGRIIATASPSGGAAVSLRRLEAPERERGAAVLRRELTGIRFAAPRKFATNAVAGAS